MGLSDIVKKVYEKQISEEAERVAKDLDKDYLENRDTDKTEEEIELEKRINVLDINDQDE